MDLGRPDPRFGTLGNVLDRGPLEVGRGVAYPGLWLGEENTGGDDTGQEGEEWRVRARGGAHLRARTREGEREAFLYKY